jgi:hypothetical protein
MADQQDRQRGRDPLSMAEINEALPPIASNIPSSPVATYASNVPQYQYQQSPPSVYPVGQYQQSYSTAQSPITFATAPSENQYFSYSPSQPQTDPSQIQLYQHGSQMGYRNNPPASPANISQHPGVQRPMPQAQPQLYNVNVPRYQYQQQYPQPMGPRAMSIPTYTTSPQTRTPPQFLQPTTYSIYNQYYLPTVPPVFSDETSSPTDPDNLLPRGPPRKPKQSGFALWVGNLPRDVLLEELKDFFVLDGLESIFLIRKSNCAFVNYKTEEACSLALSMFNDKCIPFHLLN